MNWNSNLIPDGAKRTIRGLGLLMLIGMGYGAFRDSRPDQVCPPPPGVFTSVPGYHYPAMSLRPVGPPRRTQTPYRGLTPNEKDNRWRQVMPGATRVSRDDVRTQNSPWPSEEKSWLTN